MRSSPQNGRTEPRDLLDSHLFGHRKGAFTGALDDSPGVIRAASRRTLPASERRLDPTETVVRTDQPLAALVEHVERAAIQQAMARAKGHVEDASRFLGLSRKGLYLKRKRLGLE